MKMGKEFVTVLAAGLLFLVGCGKDDKHPTTTTNQGTTDTTTTDTGTGGGNTNHTPVISSLTANPATVVTNGATSLSCNATDADNDTLSYSWSASSGTIAGSGATVSWTAPATVGTATITCKASDGTAEATTQASVTASEWILPTQFAINLAINDDYIWDATVYEGKLYLAWSKQSSSRTTYDYSSLSIFDGNTASAVELSRTEILRPDGKSTPIVHLAVGREGIFIGGYNGASDFLSAYDFSATVLWAIDLPHYLNDTYTRQIIVYDGFVYVCGDMIGQVPGFTTAGGLDVFIGKYTTSGNLVWFRQWGTTGDDNGNRINAATDGLSVTVYAGYIFDHRLPAPAYTGDLTLKYDFNGNLLSVIQ